RQIERRIGKSRRIAAGFKPLDQPAIDQRSDDAAQERHGDGNRENAHELPDSRIGCQYRDFMPVMRGLRSPVHRKISSQAVDSWSTTTTLSVVFARLAAFAKAPARPERVASSKPWRRRDRAIQYSRDDCDLPISRGVLDGPPARGMTA